MDRKVAGTLLKQTQNPIQEMITAKVQLNRFLMKPVMYFKYVRNALTLLNNQLERKHEHTDKHNDKNPHLS